MKAICLGGPYHGLNVDLPEDQDIYRPTGELQPRYERMSRSSAGPETYFIFSDLSEPQAHELVTSYLQSVGPGTSTRPARASHGVARTPR